MRTQRKWTITKIIFAIGSLTLPAVAIAQIQITEIMYDVPGSDSGREWVEVANLGVENIDIGKYKLFENNTNHGLKFVSGASILAPNGIAIIASDAQKFLADHPAFSGTLFDSTFALSNTGESLAIKNASSSELASVEYSAEESTNGTGGSLQLKDGSLVAAMESPGIYPGPITPVPKKQTTVGKTTAKKSNATSPSKNIKSLPSLNERAESPAAIAEAAQTPLFSSLSESWLWIAALVAIILVGVAGVLFVFSGKKETFTAAEEFTIE